jgi:Flp pilus assembly pilin Flp
VIWGVIAVVLVAALTTFGTGLSHAFTSAAAHL